MVDKSKKKDVIKLPKKTTIDLNIRETNKTFIFVAMVIVPAIVIGLLVFAKVGFLDKIQERLEARGKYQELYAQRIDLEKTIEGYDELEFTFRTKNLEWIQSDPTFGVVNRQKMLDILEKELLTRANVGSVSISGNSMTVSMSGMNLVELSELYAVLLNYSEIENVVTNSVSTNGSGEKDYALGFTLYITFTSGSSD